MSELQDSIMAASANLAPFRPARDTIDETLDLQRAVIGHIDFRGVTFTSFVNLRHAHLHGLAWFDRATFRRGADFSYARFDHDARFDGAVFGGAASFIESEFRGVADFDGAQFDDLCIFDRSVCFGNMSLGRVSIRGKATCRNAEFHGGLWCEQARFSEVDMTALEVHGRVILRRAMSRTTEGASKPFLLPEP